MSDYKTHEFVYEGRVRVELVGHSVKGPVERPTLSYPPRSVEDRSLGIIHLEGRLDTDKSSSHREEPTDDDRDQ